MIKDYDAYQLEADLAEGPVLLDFYSEHCGPCKMLGHVLADYDQNDNNRQLPIMKVAIEDHEQIFSDFNVLGYPTLVLVDDGEEVARLDGLQQKQTIQDMVEEAL